MLQSFSIGFLPDAGDAEPRVTIVKACCEYSKNKQFLSVSYYVPMFTKHCLNVGSPYSLDYSLLVL